MGDAYKFQCPQCGRSYKANKDLAGRLKRCGKCRGTFTIKRLAPVRKGAPPAAPEPIILHDPELPIDHVFNALHEWQKTVPSLPSAFGREITFGQFVPAYRLTLDVTIDANGHRSRDSAHRETLALPAEFTADDRRGAKKVVDLAFEHTSDLAGKLADKPVAVREAAERLAKELRPPAGGRFVARRLTVEHLQAWGAHWNFHQAEGNAWFFGRPLRVHLPDPPRRSAVPAVLATLLTIAALGAVGWVLWEYDLVHPGDRTPPAAAPAPVARPAAPAPLRFAKDGILRLDDGSFLRGALERREEAVVVQDSGGSKSVAPGQIESLHVDASVFLRGESRQLDDLAARVKSARASASRENLVGLFLEVHRQRDRWIALEAVCSASELSGDPAPKARIEGLRAEIEKLLEATAPTAVSPTAVPAAGVKAAEVPASVGVAADLLRRLAPGLDDATRAPLLAGLLALKDEKLPQSDLLCFAALYLSRSDLDEGLTSDRVRVTTPQVDSTFGGLFEKQTDSFVRLRTPSGQELTAYKEKDSWVVQAPGGIRLEGAQVTATARARTASNDRLRAALDRLPPAQWMSAPAADHLRAAKAAAAPVDRKVEGQGDHGAVLLRGLAASHAGAALRLGAPSEILEARTVLLGLGYTQSSDGRWERPEDRRAAQMGQLLREGKADEARTLLPGSPGSSEFSGAYRTAAVQLQAPLRTVEDLNRAAATLDQSLLLASTMGESRHVLALKGSLAGFGICPSCGGSPAKVCLTCRGKGTRTEACLSCGGLGYKTTVGIGATGHKTCEVCNGKPIRGTRPCEICQGKGTRSCAKCQGVTRLPTPTDLSRTRACARCSGSGGHGDAVIHACSSCAGLGVQLVPAGTPDATLP